MPKMTTEDQEVLTLFLEESFEGLGRAETALLEMEEGAPGEGKLNGLFRELHTIKGTSGFLDLHKIESLSHAAEDVLARLRDGAIKLSSDRVTLLLKVCDALRVLLGRVKQSGSEGDDDVRELVAALRAELAPNAGASKPAGAAVPDVASPAAAAKAPATPAPKTTALPQPAATPKADPTGGRPFEVMVASESAEERELLQAALLGAGLTVVPVADGGDALGRMRGLRPGDPPPTSEIALLSSTLVSSLDGPDAARRYLEGEKPTPKVPIVLIVDSPEEGERGVTRAGGAGVEYLVRPLNGGVLVEHLRALVQRHREALTRPSDAGRANIEDQTIRVGVHLLDRLMNLVGELVLARNQILQVASNDKDARSGVLATAQRLNIVTSELQEQVMRTRMQPIARLFDQIPRMVRSTSKACGKEVVVRTEGNTTELDRTFVELMRDPLMHIIRNAIDHGIESPEKRRAVGKPPGGLLRVRAYHEGGNVNIEIEDDGAGMDPTRLRQKAVSKGLVSQADASRMSDREAIDLVFLPGFSTAEQVTSVSGRGVGMDVVRTQVERAGGQVELHSSLRRGTTVRLKIPLTLAIVPALMVASSGYSFAIPQINVMELVRLGPEQVATVIERVRGAEVYRLRGTVLPIVRLPNVIRAEPAISEDGSLFVVVVAAGDRKFGLLVEGVKDTVEIVVKPLHRQIKRLQCYSGATILGDGSIALILDVVGLAAMSGMKVVSGRAAAEVRTEAADAAHREALLVFSASGTPCAVPLSLVSRIERIPAAQIEAIAGRELLQYRGRLMPVLRPEQALGLRCTDPLEEQPVIVFDFGRPVGFAVSAIIDVVETSSETIRNSDARPGVLGAMVLLGKTSLLLDVFELVRSLAPEHATETADPANSRPRQVLVVDDSNMMRSIVANYLTSVGYEVSTAKDAESALTTMQTQRFDAVMTDLEMPGMGGFGLLDQMRGTPELADIPVVVVTRHESGDVMERAMSKGASAYVNKLDRSELGATLARLLSAPRRAA
jgi:two-component system, chemotaxis family, sensor kinase CheA